MTKIITTGWIAAGAAFLAYPSLRPYADETGLDGLAAMASNAWIGSHLLGMAAFALLAMSVRSSYGSVSTSRAGRAASTLMGVALVLLLPYYGGEAFGLHAIGQRGVSTGDAGLVATVDAFRYQPVAISMFGLGLVLLAVVGVLLAVAGWRAGGLVRIAALTVGVGLALYVPQFYGPGEVRILHGVLLAVGCVLLGLAHRRATARPVVAEPGLTTVR